MDRQVQKYLYDILDCIAEIESYFINMPKRFDTYCQNRMMRKAIQMNITIIGEATNRILKLNPDIRITNARQIVGTRNYLIHGYDSLRLEMIWAIIINDLPKLKSEVQHIICETESESES